MLKFFGSNIKIFRKDNLFGSTISYTPLIPKDLTVTGDISSAAFLLVAAATIKNSDLILKGIGLNPTRTGVIDVLKAMNADIEILSRNEISGEEIGDIRIKIFARPQRNKN